MSRPASILVVEDEPFLLMMYEDAVLDAGHRPVLHDDVAGGLADARPGIDVAILDIRLHDEFVFPIAQRLSEIGVPFLFASGTMEDLPCDAFRDVPMLRKPISAPAVVARALSLLRDKDSCAA